MKSKNGFTLVELLAVILLIAVLGGMVFGAASLVKRSARKTQITVTAAALETALSTYRSTYGKWPIPSDVDAALSKVASSKDFTNSTIRAITVWSEETSSGRKVFMRCAGKENYEIFDALRTSPADKRLAANPSGLSFVSDSSVDTETPAGLVRRCYAPMVDGVVEAGHPLAFRMPKSGKVGYYSVLIDFESDYCQVEADSDEVKMFQKYLFETATHRIVDFKTTYYGACPDMDKNEVLRKFTKFVGGNSGHIKIYEIK